MAKKSVYTKLYSFLQSPEGPKMVDSLLDLNSNLFKRCNDEKEALVTISEKEMTEIQTEKLHELVREYQDKCNKQFASFYVSIVLLESYFCY